MVEHKDSDAAKHINRIAAGSKTMAELLGMAPGYAESIFLCNAMHDIGNIMVSSDILLKPGQPTAPEWNLVYQHPGMGPISSVEQALPFLAMGSRNRRYPSRMLGWQRLPKPYGGRADSIVGKNRAALRPLRCHSQQTTVTRRPERMKKRCVPF